MKLQPRERRPRSDYIVDNAAALHLGRLYLGWGRSKAHSRTKRATLATKSRSKAAPAKAAKKATPSSPRTPAEKVPTKPAAPAAVVVKCTPENPRKTPPPAAPVTGAAAKSRGGGNAAAKSQKPTARKNRSPVVKLISSKVVVAAAAAAGSASAEGPPKPLPRAPRKTSAVPTTKIVVQRRRRTNRNAPPVIPSPIPTPALSLREAEETVDSGNVTVLVRTVNGTSFSLACSCESTLYNLKRRILENITPGAASASPDSMARLPMLVMNGRALGPEAATLAALRFSTNSTVYCFPEPN
ncbi:hypothetical protein LSCM4_01442 [Leishmania orientalis]|uniref:Ubiquitin-like domain-containing protein n=1 Tax=Leishmania orientalis TaxID=2249476 RepID=A0A836KAE8_9TRYP|nr:hypothetical protein LSCM4_01442 [Leishmania orientalis]